MPAAADLPWSTIAAQAGAGATLEELSEHWGVPVGTLKSRSATEGWKKPLRAIQPNSTERALALMGKLDGRSKLRAAKVGDKSLAALQRKDDDQLLRNSSAYLNTVNALAKVHGWGSEGKATSPLVNINVLNQSVPDA